MSEGVLFAIIFVGFFVLRGIAATIVFYFILPDNDRCPMCDAPTLHVHSPLWGRTLPGLRASWCPDCRWEGMLRRSGRGTAQALPAPTPSEESGTRG